MSRRPLARCVLLAGLGLSVGGFGQQVSHAGDRGRTGLRPGVQQAHARGGPRRNGPLAPRPKIRHRHGPRRHRGPERVWVPARYEIRERQVIIPAQAETVYRQVWIEPVYEVRTRQVWVPAVAPGNRLNIHLGGFELDVNLGGRQRCGHYETIEERVLLRPGYYDTVAEQIVTRPQCVEVVQDKVLVREGYWKRVGRFH